MFTYSNPFEAMSGFNTNLLDLAKNQYEAAKQLADINMRTSEKLMQKQLELFGLYLQANADQMDLLTKAKGFQELYAGQAELARGLAEKVMASARESAEVATGARDEVTAWMEKGAEAVAANLKEVTTPKAA
ncbi:MAG: phasin family protein [Chromatiales bacterium]|nr:phasin family protein [Chromatiales bacterium]